MYGDSLANVHNLGDKLPNGDALQSLRMESPVFYRFAKDMKEKDCGMVKPIVESLNAPFLYTRSHQAHQTGKVEEASGDNHEYFPGNPTNWYRGKSDHAFLLGKILSKAIYRAWI